MQGRYETAYGLTRMVAIMRGLGQGDVASPARSKLLLDLMARAVDKISQGKQVAGVKERVPLMYFADDGKFLADDVQTLQRMYEASWMVAKIAGLDLQVKKKKKTAWYATYWEEGGTERDVEGWEMRMPDGETVIPQLVGAEKYKYLGTELRAGWGGGQAYEDARANVVNKCRNAIAMLGRVKQLTHRQMETAMALVLSGFIGYYGRSTVLTWGLRTGGGSQGESAASTGVHDGDTAADHIRGGDKRAGKRARVYVRGGGAVRSGA